MKVYEERREDYKKELAQFTLQSQQEINSIIILFYVKCFTLRHRFKDDQILDPMKKISCKKGVLEIKF